jgi:hypothetical protein
MSQIRLKALEIASIAVSGAFLLHIFHYKKSF